MSNYFAELKATSVQRVIVADNAAWCEMALGGVWIETFIDVPGHNYAGIGYTYHADITNFAAPQPFASWLLDDACHWQAPIAQPSGIWQWDEAALTWRKPFSMASDKSVVTANGVDMATIAVWSASDVAEITLSVRDATATLPLAAGIGTLQLTFGAPTLPPHVVVKASDQALFGIASVTVEAVE